MSAVETLDSRDYAPFSDNELAARPMPTMSDRVAIGRFMATAARMKDERDKLAKDLAEARKVARVLAWYIDGLDEAVDAVEFPYVVEGLRTALAYPEVDHG